MSLKVDEIDLLSDGYYLDGSVAIYSSNAPAKLQGQPIVGFQGHGSAIAFGGGLFLTAAHLFDGVEVSANGPVEFIATSQNVGGTPAAAPTDIEPWNAQDAYQGIGSGHPMPDLAVLKTNQDMPAAAPSPVIVFADDATAANFLARQGQIYSAGANTSPTTGSFDRIIAPGVFATTNQTAFGDSGGPAYITTSSGVSYVVGVDSYGATEGPDPTSKFSYLDNSDYNAVIDVLPSNANFSTMPPDILLEGSTANNHVRGSVRKADIITNGDNDVILAGSGGGLINTEIGKNDVVFLPAATGQTDPGTDIVVAPGTTTIVGGGPNDRLVLLADRLQQWSGSQGSAPPAPQDVSDLVPLLGGATTASKSNYFYFQTELADPETDQNGRLDFVYDRNLGAYQLLLPIKYKTRTCTSVFGPIHGIAVWR